jgi:hypothetical protein
MYPGAYSLEAIISNHTWLQNPSFYTKGPQIHHCHLGGSKNWFSGCSFNKLTLVFFQSLSSGSYRTPLCFDEAQWYPEVLPREGTLLTCLEKNIFIYQT